jgi:ferrochelatase
MRELKESGARRVLAFVTSGFSCYSGCRQYRENIYAAQDEADANDIEIHKIRVFYNHPDFVAVNAENVGKAIDEASEGDASDVHIAFTAHSLPLSMSTTSDYEKQLHETCRLVAEQLGIGDDRWRLVYQSRSGRPQDPWLEPDICDYLEELNSTGVKKVVISPVGFLSDHMEVLYDLDDEAKKACERLGMKMARAATPGTHPQFVAMIRKLIEERANAATPECIGQFGPNHDVCPTDCCPAPAQRPARPETAR